MIFIRSLRLQRSIISLKEITILPVMRVPNIFSEWGESESLSLVSDSLWPHGLCSSRNSPGQNIGMGSLSLFQGIFPTQGLNPGLPHCRWILYQLSHKGSPRILEWVAYLLTQESNWGLLHCGWIFYQLSYQGSWFSFIFSFAIWCFSPWCGNLIKIIDLLFYVYGGFVTCLKGLSLPAGL